MGAPLPPHGIDEIRRVFGDIVVKNGVVLPRGWEDNCVIARNLPLWGPRPLYIHKLILEPLIAALTECAAYNVAHPDEAYVLETLGCFNPRNKRSNPVFPSLHSWAIALDINAKKNPPIEECSLSDLRRLFGSGHFTLPRWWVDIWRKIGWTWGGDFRGSYFDPMHFQFASGY